MIKNELDGMIASAMKNGDTLKLNTLRSIKASIKNFETAENGHQVTESDELKILLKMKSQREDSINQYKAGGRDDLAESETKELECLMQFIPQQPSDDDIAKYTLECVKELLASQGSISMKDMKSILSMVQSKYPTANGKIVSQVVKSNI